MHDDFYQMYLDELNEIPACSKEEEQSLLKRLSAGDLSAKARLIEGTLHMTAALAGTYADRGLPMGDLVQEANMALMMTVDTWKEGAFWPQVEQAVKAALEAAIDEQKHAANVEEEMLARVNVLKDISQSMAEELGREATVEELAERMKMTPDEIRAIMKLTLDAMSVSPDAEA